MAVGQGRLIKNSEIESKIANIVKQLPSCLKDIEIYLYDNQPTTRYEYLKEIRKFIIYLATDKRVAVTDLTMQDILSVTSLYLKKYFKSKNVIIGNDGIEKPSSGTYRKMCWTGVNTLYKFLVAEDYISENPCSKTKRPTLQDHPKFDHLQDKEIQALFADIQRQGKKKKKSKGLMYRDLAIVAVALETGLRASAIVSIMIGDIDYETQILTVIDKGEKIFQFDLSNTLIQYLKDWLSYRDHYVKQEENDFLFLSQQGAPINYDTVLYLVRKYTSHIGRPMSPHKLRATYARIVYDHEKDIVLLKDMMQHSSINTTQRYVQNLDAEYMKKKTEVKRQIMKALYQRETV